MQTDLPVRVGRGFRYESANEILMRINAEADAAQERVDLRAEINLARSLVQEIERLWTRTPEEDSEIIRNLTAIKDALSADKFVQPEDAENLAKVLEDCILKERGLFEYVKGKPAAMSSKTKGMLTNSLLATLSKLVRDHIAVTASDTVLKDDVLVRTKQAIALTWRIMDKYGMVDKVTAKMEWLESYADIWSTMPTKKG